MREMLKALYAALRGWIALLRKERNKRAFSLIKGKLLLVLKRLAPKKGSGYLHFGSGDPYNTGRAMEIAAFLYPLYGDSIEVTPIFDRAELETRLDVKGRFCLGQVVIPFLMLLKDRDVRRFLREAMEQAEGGADEG